MNDEKENVEDVYAYAKTDTRGAARFKSEDQLWVYMQRNKGNHVHTYQSNRIYVKVNDASTVDGPKDKAVRKVVRCIIEQWGSGDGTTTKQRIEAKYPWGAVWWLGTDNKWKKIAQWDSSRHQMDLVNGGEVFQSAFDVLMN